MIRPSSKTSLLSILVLPIFFSGLFAGFSPCKEEPPAKMTLEFWGVYDDSDVYQPLIQAFNQQYPHITINYYKKNPVTYEKELIDALAAGRGPDIFLIHHTWLPRYKDKLAPAPPELLSSKNFKEMYVDVASQDFLISQTVEKDGSASIVSYVLGLPFSVDTLALFYNKDLLNDAGLAQPPGTWEEFNNAVQKLTLRDTDNNIWRAGAALGTAKNVNRSTDILSLLMLQGGAKMVSNDKRSVLFTQPLTLSSGESFNPGERALLYYTGFANPAKKVYTWNQYQHYSLDAFVEGKVAMMLNYSYQIPVLRSRAPHLNSAIAPLPQISTGSLAVSYANYWGLVVSRRSPAWNYAWQFLAWLNQLENQKKYLVAANRPTSRRDLIEWQKENNPDLEIFTQQALTAKSWYQVDNSAIETILAEMIEAVANGRLTAPEALSQAVQQINVLMSKGSN